MKKNKAMRSASVLLVATLLTTSVISGTLAKYTTQDAAEDTARVAKWGVELQAIGNLYGDTYKDLIVTENDTNATVQSVDKTADVVAPGTQNTEGFTFSLKGKPEVDGTITTTITSQNIFLKAGTYGIMIPVDSEVVTAANFDELSGLCAVIRHDNQHEEKQTHSGAGNSEPCQLVHGLFLDNTHRNRF